MMNTINITTYSAPHGTPQPSKLIYHGVCNRLLLFWWRQCLQCPSFFVVVPTVRVSWAVGCDVPGIVTKIADSWVWTSKGCTAVGVVIETIRTTAPFPKLAHTFGWVVIDNTALGMIVKATLTLTSPAKCTWIHRCVDIATFGVCIWAITPLATTPKTTWLGCFEPQDPLFFALPCTLLDDVLRYRT